MQWRLDCDKFHWPTDKMNLIGLLAISIFFQEYTCPLCAGGFIEELPPNGTQGRNASSNDDVEIPSEIEGHRLNERISSLLMSSGFGGNHRPSLDDEGDQTHDGSSSSKSTSAGFLGY